MKKNYRKQIILAAFAGLSLVACNSNSDDYPPLHPMIQKITAHTWKVGSIYTPSKTNPAQDSSIAKACTISGALIGFNVQGIFQFQDNTAGGCDSTVLPYDAGYWGLKNTEDSLLFAGIKKSQRMRLLKLTDDTLQVRFVDTLGVQNYVQKTITFIK